MARQAKPYRVTVVRYHLPSGERCKSTTPGSIKTKEKSDTYYARIDGRTPVSLETDDLGNAWAEFRKRLKRREEEKRGIVSKSMDDAGRPFGELLDEWKSVVMAKGTSEKQGEQSRRRVEHIAKLAGWRRVSDVTADSCLNALATLQRSAGRGGKPGRSAQTRNHYLTQTKHFVRWACKRSNLPFPLDDVASVRVESDRRHDRRSPTDKEIATLFKHLEGRCSKVLFGMTGKQRALGYKVAMATGFRANELRSLSRENFDLARGIVTLTAAAEKRRTGTEQPLPAWLVKELAAWFKKGGETWESLPAADPGRKTLQKDLKAAGVPRWIQGPNGKLYFDFHSLRHWYCTQIASQPGIDPKTLMELTRLSSAQLALEIYAKAQTGRIRNAAEQVPRPGSKL